MPRHFTNSHLLEPVNPFKQYDTNEEYKQVLNTLECEDQSVVMRVTDDDLPPATDFMLTDKQYEDLFIEGPFAIDATY